ncbi:MULTISPECIES: YfiT family bacillithiol transferase [Cohnella]|uniref:YfiT family bacillithiol transferase n=1 Tax=Cohnella TaxID=329857 RepID=UPI0009BB8919|nr:MULTISPECIES: putative metal-dependent hydrolase [Cohnella]MBN2983185.1 putative metal-dependent hydrolase [Cohnella algarum]
MENEENLRYPVGAFEKPSALDMEEIRRWIGELPAAPENLRLAVRDLSDEQLDTPYRPGGWTARQVVHHMADALMQQYTRFKLGLTENEPTIAAFEEDEWAKLPDSARFPVDSSLLVFEGVAVRLEALLRTLDASVYERKFIHPANGPTKLYELFAYAAWHIRHHTAHITSLRQRNGW